MATSQQKRERERERDKCVASSPYSASGTGCKMSHYTVQGRRAEHKGLWKSCLACNPCAAQVPAHSQTWTGCHCLKETWRNDCCPCYSHKTSREGGIAQAPLSYSTWRLFCCTLLRETMKDCCCCFPRKP
ncbi:hypothetical protein QQF64_017534 [Cirrhinus molitorella]|uniref:Uncharacterized protein n=1 Tax=Cirrhinus molitorella TaxID=172907 RepID=A0ABR3LL91_9TELE